MNLPNYFLADLPPEATLSPTMITEACQTLKRNRDRYLAQRATHNLAQVLAEVAKGWLQTDNRFRKLALEHGPAETGFSRATLAKGLDNFFHQLTPENFSELLEQELGEDSCHVSRVTCHVPRHFWRGPEFLVHIAAGNIPNPTLTSIVLGLLARSAQFVKCASRSAFLPRLLAHSIYDADPKLGACLEIAEWPGGHEALEAAVLEEADCVTATGSDEALAAIRQRLPMGKRFLGYGHRVSFAYVAANVIGGSHLRRV